MCGRMSVSKKMEQQLNVKFLIKFEKSGAEINEMLSMVYSGHPSSSYTRENVDRVYVLVLANQQITTGELAEEMQRGKGTIHMILHNDLQLM